MNRRARRRAPRGRGARRDRGSKGEPGPKSEGAAPADAGTAPAVGTAVFAEVDKRLTAEHVAQVEGIFQFDVNKPDGGMVHWTLDMKNGSGSVYQGKPTGGEEANTTMTMSEETRRR